MKSSLNQAILRGLGGQRKVIWHFTLKGCLCCIDNEILYDTHTHAHTLWFVFPLGCWGLVSI